MAFRLAEVVTVSNQNQTAGVRALPCFQGYTIDVRLREFRRVREERNGIKILEIYSFSSDEGISILAEIGLLTLNEIWDSTVTDLID
jgi:hypothetical protein